MEKRKNFKDLGLDKWLIEQCLIMNISNPTPVQKGCIPKILKGANCIGNAKTGSGKTAAFALPILQKFSEDPYGIFALVLTPTRELAYQIADHFMVLGKPLNIKITVIVGGNDMMMQGRDMSFIPHIIISTPGRLVDHIETYGDLKFDRLKFFVMDEADRLLAGYFNEQLSTIMKLLPKKRQNLIFSATFNQALQTLCDISLAETKPFIWRQDSEFATVDTLHQFYLLTPFHIKESYMVYVMLDFLNKLDDTLNKSKIMSTSQTLKSMFKTDEHSLAIIFTSSCKKCQVLHSLLKRLGIPNLPIHSNLTQKQRLVALTKFKSGLIRILIATDLASRGLDIPKVDLVLNHTVPSSPEDYVHRVGRTARAGREGISVTLISPPKDIPVLQDIESHIGTKTLEYTHINEKIILKILTEITMVKRECQMDIENSDFDKRRQINEIKHKILQGQDLTPEERKICTGYKCPNKPTIVEKKNGQNEVGNGKKISKVPNKVPKISSKKKIIRNNTKKPNNVAKI